MLALLLALLACAGQSDNSVTTTEPVFDGYVVQICVVSTTDMSSIGEDPMVTVLQAPGFDRLTMPNEYVLSHDVFMEENHWCTKDITLFAEQDGQALYTGVAPFRNTYIIDKVEVTYQAWTHETTIDNFPFTATRVSGCYSGFVCGTIEPKRDDTGWWRFNILSVTGNDGIPTAIVDLPARRQ